MLHACLLPITLCFTGTSWCFYGFSATKILTRCHSASFCFLLFFIPEKLKNKYSWNRKNKLFYKVSYWKTPKARRGHLGGWASGPTPTPGAPRALPAPGHGVAHQSSPRLCPFAYLSPWTENPKYS